VTAAAKDLYIKGVRVETYGDPSQSAPLLFVHGGGQGSWAWEKIAPRLAQHGWYAVCLNWFDHNGSAPLDQSRALTRSLLDITTEIAIVAETLDRPPVLISHSMGSIPSLEYATANEVTAMVLLAPVLPAGFGADITELEVDPETMYTPPLERLKPLFWSEVSDDESRRYTSLFVPESPRAVLETTRSLCEVDTSKVRVPALVIAAGADDLIPPQVELLADAINAAFLVLEDQTHGININPIWTQVAEKIQTWLSRLQLPNTTR